MIYLTGSRALHHWYPQFEIKPDADWDIVGDVESSKDLRVDVAPVGLNSLEVCEVYGEGEVDTPVGRALVLGPRGLMLFKRSHLHRPLDFAKHIRHYHFLKGMVGVDEEYFRLLAERTVLTKGLYGDRVPSLRKSKVEFFDDFVSKRYEHDAIHYATCFGDRPIYEELRTDANSVWCSRARWESLPFEMRVNCVREEAFVIAIERWLIPRRGYPARFAFLNAVERICTTLTSGWFRDFAIDNWLSIVDCTYDFVGRFKNAGFEIH